MFASASLLYNKLRGGNRNRGVNRGFIFQTTFRHRGGYYATNSQTKIFILILHSVKTKLTFIAPDPTSDIYRGQCTPIL